MRAGAKEGRAACDAAQYGLPMRWLTALLLALTATTAVAYDPIVLSRGWWRVDAFADGECTGEVGTNGKFYVISASGFAPGERAFLTITNGDMRPIERSVRANAAGEWQDYYLPFRFGQDGGAVAVTLAGSRCVVPLGFGWNRAPGNDDLAPFDPR
jgi:hypothetical protein